MPLHQAAHHLPLATNKPVCANPSVTISSNSPSLPCLASRILSEMGAVCWSPQTAACPGLGQLAQQFRRARIERGPLPSLAVVATGETPAPAGRAALSIHRFSIGSSQRAKNRADRRPNQRAQFDLAHRQTARRNAARAEYSNPRQRIQQRPIQVEEHRPRPPQWPPLPHHFGPETSMFSASSSGERNGYMSSRFGVRILRPVESASAASAQTPAPRPTARRRGSAPAWQVPPSPSPGRSASPPQTMESHTPRQPLTMSGNVTPLVAPVPISLP